MVKYFAYLQTLTSVQLIELSRDLVFDMAERHGLEIGFPECKFAYFRFYHH